MAGIVSVLGALSLVRASDHLDGPRTTADRQADITDAFAFTSPENPAHVVLAMTVTPFASASSTFSNQVDYVFRVRRVTALQPLTLDTTVLDVTCDFDDASPQKITCLAPGGLQITAPVGDPVGGGGAQGPMRVFAGLRSDPAFFDRQGALAMAATARANFTGQNAFVGANVLGIVIELDTLAAFAATVGAAQDAAVETASGQGGGLDAQGGVSMTPPILAIACETVRKGH